VVLLACFLFQSTTCISSCRFLGDLVHCPLSFVDGRVKEFDIAISFKSPRVAPTEQEDGSSLIVLIVSLCGRLARETHFFFLSQIQHGRCCRKISICQRPISPCPCLSVNGRATAFDPWASNFLLWTVWRSYPLFPGHGEPFLDLRPVLVLGGFGEKTWTLPPGKSSLRGSKDPLGMMSPFSLFV